MDDSSMAERALVSGLVQPDSTTCGSCVLVVARMLRDPLYAAFLVTGASPVFGNATGTVRDRFRLQALATHRLTSEAKDSRGGWRLPWPRALGTQPWALAREMGHQAGRAYDVHAVLPHRRERDFARVVSLANDGHPIPLYVGNRWSPRHVVLALPSDQPAQGRVMIYDPANGRRYPISAEDFAAGRLDVAGWDVPWVVVLPS